MEMAIIIGVVVVIGGGIAVAYAMSNHSKKEQAARERYRAPNPTPEPKYEPTETCTDNLGAPIFDDSPETRKPVVDATAGQVVWCVTPYGPMRGEIETVSSEKLVIDCGDYTVWAEPVPMYFSESLARKLGVSRKAWVLSDIKHSGWNAVGTARTYFTGQGRLHRPTITQRTGGVWLRDHTIFGDFTDIMVEFLWYEMMFGAFDQPVDYYDSLEPIYEDGEATGDIINWVTAEERAEEQSSFEQAQAEVEAAAEKAAETGEPQLTATQQQDDTPDDGHSFFDSPSETKYADPEPAPAPDPVEDTTRYSSPSYDPPSYGGGGGGYDSGGGGYDSGGDSGGGGFD